MSLCSDESRWKTIAAWMYREGFYVAMVPLDPCDWLGKAALSVRQESARALNECVASDHLSWRV